MKNLRFFLSVLALLSVFVSPLSLAAEDAVPIPAVRININTADAQTLANTLNGVGVKKAEAIIEYRTSYGPFQSVDELIEVKGIGKSLIAINRDLIALD
jgi:competence protein ComEA